MSKMLEYREKVQCPLRTWCAVALVGLTHCVRRGTTQGEISWRTNARAVTSLQTASMQWLSSPVRARSLPTIRAFQT